MSMFYRLLRLHVFEADVNYISMAPPPQIHLGFRRVPQHAAASRHKTKA